MKILEYLRMKVVQEALELNTLDSVWPIWSEKINQCLGKNPNANKYFNLGNQLYEIFQSTNLHSENLTLSELQSIKSRAGTLWEVLNMWYLNICSLGSQVVAIKKKKQTPSPFIDAMCITHMNASTTSESDLKVCVFPNTDSFKISVNDLSRNNDIENIIENDVYQYLSDKVAENISYCHLLNIQTKTNFNDTIQAPMLYNIAYALGSHLTEVDENLNIGRNGISITSLSSFKYAFSTVPTNNPDNINANNLAAARGRVFTGGNYWGLETKNNVAKNIKEVFSTNIRNGYRGLNVQESLNEFLSHHPNTPEYFKI